MVNLLVDGATYDRDIWWRVSTALTWLLQQKKK